MQGDASLMLVAAFAVLMAIGLVAWGVAAVRTWRRRRKRKAYGMYGGWVESMDRPTDGRR